MKASPKFSQASKMPCPSWSLPAIVTCPGAIGPDGSLVAACSGCYAAQGHYLFGNVKDLRQHNMEDWQREGWIAAMVAEIGKHDFFRWFDSGDVYQPLLAVKIYVVCKRTPNTRHWIPSRAHKDPRVASMLARIAELPNVVVRYSSDSTTGERLEGFAQTSTIVKDTASHNVGRMPDGRIAARCTAWQREGKCGPCRACWDKRIDIMEYPEHGNAVSPKTIARLLPERAAALA